MPPVKVSKQLYTNIDESLDSAYAAKDPSPKAALHAEVIKWYSWLLLGFLAFWMIIATLTFWVAGICGWDVGVSLAIFCVSPILGLLIVIGSIAHHSFRTDVESKKTDDNSLLLFMQSLVEKISS